MGAANTFNFVKPGPGGAQPAYALGMDNSLQWGRPADSLGHQNIYAVSSIMLPNVRIGISSAVPDPSDSICI